MLNRWMISMFVLALIGHSPAAAQEAVATQASQEVVEVQEKDGKVSLDFREADIRNVLKVLALKSGINIVASPEVTGLVTIQLNEVPWRQALDVILQTYGYAYEQKGNIILVTTVENLKQRREDAMLLAEQEPLITETFTLNFAKASDVIASVEKMKSDRGSINYDERTNILIVTDTASKIELVSNVVGKLDKTTPQVLIEAKIIETTFSDSENLGVDWITQATIGGSTRPIIWPFDDETDSRFAPDAFPGASGGDFTYGTLDFSQVQAVFEMLATRSDTNILSNPRIVTLDNQAAQITVGSQYPIPTYTYNEEQARLQVSGWEYMDIGIIFDVTPHVNSAGFVTLD
ncbi:MAG: secretin and TonB N-terminal domain-containing protein, partial [Candidatus Omnitrophica bacterium]|nr:secretin and TonB N-terminal domain-containing protein [Candidatus Omnitrophota bacterium]